jgi:hypothetical protein
MRFPVGQTVTNAITNEVGQIRRVVDMGGLAYIVTLRVNGTEREVEALWRPAELKEFAARVRKRPAKRKGT